MSNSLFIDPLALAKKVRFLESGERFPVTAFQDYPTLRETLWYLQGLSALPNGLEGCLSGLVERKLDEMCFPLQAKGGRLSEWVGILMDWNLRVEDLGGPRSVREQVNRSSDYILSRLKEMSAEEIDGLEASDDEDDRLTARRLRAVTPQEFRDHVCESLKKRIPEFVHTVCTVPYMALRPHPRNHRGLPPKLFHFIFESLEEMKATTLARIARTKVAEMIFQELDYASEERGMVRIEGDSRFGKTEAVKAWCDANAGKARKVNVPSSGSLQDLLRSVAEALNIRFGHTTPALTLKQKIREVLETSHIMLVMDEAQFLIPQDYSKNVKPHRLNWLRTEILDRGLPVALISTPQTFGKELDAYVKKTQWTFEQFLGRQLLTVRLPDKLGIADMIEVARIHFPELDEDALEFVAGFSKASEAYLATVEALAKRARFLARRAGKQSPGLSELQAAAEQVAPGQGSLSKSAPPKPAPRGRIEPQEELPTPQRGTTPNPKKGNVYV